MNSWIRFGNCGNERRRLCLAKDDVIKPSSYYERFLKSVQSVRLRLSLVRGLHIDFEPNVSSGVTAVWPLGLIPVPSTRCATAEWSDATNRWRRADCTRTATAVSNPFSFRQ